MLALVVLSLSAGLMVAIHGICLPALQGAVAAVDPNLGTPLGRAITLRGTEAELAAAVLVWIVWPRGTARSPGPMAILPPLLVLAAALQRFWLAPALFEAWARVDRVSLRPRLALEAIGQLEPLHHALLGLALGLHLVLGTVVLRMRRSPSPTNARPPTMKPETSHVVANPLRTLA